MYYKVYIIIIIKEWMCVLVYVIVSNKIKMETKYGFIVSFYKNGFCSNKMLLIKILNINLRL